MKLWETELHLTGGEGKKAFSSTSFKGFSLRQAGDIIKKIRTAEMKEGREKRKLSPVSRYLLDELITRFFEENDTDDVVLEKIIIKDIRG